MKVVQINATCGVGSTGKICVGISNVLTNHNIENYILYSSRTNGYKFGISCSNERDIKFQALKSRVLGNYGFNSIASTKRMIAELDRIQPDIVHLHNIHGHDCNIEMLFKYFREKKTKLFWTFHDCWAFTGYCTYFTMQDCNKWKVKCSQCAQKGEYSFLFDKSGELFEKKKRLFDGLDLTIITPSQWLADLTSESFLGMYPVKVINNGIDLEIFKPIASSFRQRYGIENKKIVLGVSFGWEKRKGLDVFVELVKRLPDDYQIILVGTDDKIDRQLPDNILSIHRTQNQKELAEIYTAADVFVNPTREENYPTVNMESLACGTPVITFNTGGSSEILDDTCGLVVACTNVDVLFEMIVQTCEEGAFSVEACTQRALTFDADKKYQAYVELYKEVLSECASE